MYILKKFKANYAIFFANSFLITIKPLSIEKSQHRSEVLLLSRKNILETLLLMRINFFKIFYLKGVTIAGKLC